MADKPATPEELFRFGLEGVVEMAQKLLPYCKSTEDLVGMCRLALENEGQFQLLMKATGVQQPAARRVVG